MNVARTEPRALWWRRYWIRSGDTEDIEAMAQPGGLAWEFWAESDYQSFTGFDPEQWVRSSLAALADGQNFLVVAVERSTGQLVGFTMVSVLRWFTTDPIASTYLLFVLPRHRLSPLGRALVAAACEIAKGEGAAAFMVGSMAGVSAHTNRGLLNMLAKMGFQSIGGFARKVLG